MDIEAIKNDYIKLSNINEVYLASFKYEKIQKQIQEFQDNLSEDLDVCVQIASYGDKLIYVEDIGYQNPDILFFYIYLNNNKVQLIKHISQLNFMLVALPKQETTRKPNRIGGFQLNN